MNTIDLNDIPRLKEESMKAYQWLVEKYPHFDDPINVTADDSVLFPIRWKTKISNAIFEWVISDMGSVTLRLGEVEGNRRNPAPIFYLSLRKSEEGTLVWTDPDGNYVSFPHPTILEDVKTRVQLYLDSAS